ncbi:MAG TPA: hypothetical protein DCS19_08005 [Flavobacterium sp.]|nr:hypothetical protein [Flavobacterium sp.]
MKLKEIIKRNYEATVRRGQISIKTSFVDFFLKTEEEFDELKMSTWTSNIYPFDPKESIDIILVQFSMLNHYGFDVEKLLIEKVLFNEKRED